LALIIGLLIIGQRLIGASLIVIITEADLNDAITETVIGTHMHRSQTWCYKSVTWKRYLTHTMALRR